ncbi:MAG: hypothetical protein GY906_19770 [bacterium]|nr:hypothetical protein [bacterium]
MSPKRWGDIGNHYDPPLKQPVPVDGIAAVRFGSTWWGREWIASLERLGRGWANRLPYGRSYARQGRVVDLEVGAGIITAGFVGSRPRPYRVQITVRTFSTETWCAALECITGDVSTVLCLLQRELPENLGERLRQADVDLFPNRHELKTRCTCPDVTNPCKHVAAVHYLFAAAVDYDPFLILCLRGLKREDLIAEVSGETSEFDSGSPVDWGDRIEDPEDVASMDVAGFIGRDLRIPKIELDPRQPRVELVGIKRLGPPPRGLEQLPMMIAPTIRAAGCEALRLAWAPADSCNEVDAIDFAGPNGAARPSTGCSVAITLERQLEAVLSETERPLLKREILARIPEDPVEINAVLRRLRAANLVVARGRGPGTRYALNVRLVSVKNSSADKSMGDPASRVCETLGRSSRPMSMRSLADKLEMEPQQLRSIVISLRQNGIVEKVGYRRSARYRLVK